MKKITFSLARADIFNDVILSSAYRSAKNARGEVNPNHGAMTEGDRRLANSFFDLALGNLLNVVRPFACGVSNPDTVLDLSLNLSDDWPDYLRPQVDADLAAFFRHSILAEWLSLLNDPEADKHLREAALRAAAIIESLYLRPRPERR